MYMIRKFILYWLPPLAVMTLIFMLSTRQNLSISDQHIVNFIFFKSLHIGEYALLTLLLFRGLFNTTRFPYIDMAQISALGSTLYGITDEIHQTFVPTRSGALRDIGIDLIGILLVYIFLMRFQQYVRRYMY